MIIIIICSSLTTVRGQSDCTVTSYKPVILLKSSRVHLESPPMLTQLISSQTSPPKILSKERSGSPGYDATIRDPGLENASFLSSDIFAVIQADWTDSEVCRFNTGGEQVTQDHRKSKRTNTPVSKPQRNGNSKSRSANNGTNTLVGELLPLGCLSILRRDENGLFDQEKSQSRENTCCGRPERGLTIVLIIELQAQVFAACVVLLCTILLLMDVQAPVSFLKSTLTLALRHFLHVMFWALIAVTCSCLSFLSQLLIAPAYVAMMETHRLLCILIVDRPYDGGVVPLLASQTRPVPDHLSQVTFTE